MLTIFRYYLWVSLHKCSDKDHVISQPQIFLPNANIYKFVSEPHLNAQVLQQRSFCEKVVHKQIAL